MSERRGPHALTLAGWCGLLFAAALLLTPRLLSLPAAYLGACFATAGMRRHDLVLPRRAARLFALGAAGAALLVGGLRFDAIVRAEGLRSATSRATVALHPGVLREDAPQRVYVHAPRAGQVRLAGRPGAALGAGLFRVDLGAPRAPAALRIDGAEVRTLSVVPARDRPGAMCRSADEVAVVSTTTDRIFRVSASGLRVVPTHDRPIACAFVSGKRGASQLAVAHEDGRVTRNGRAWLELPSPLRGFVLDGTGAWVASTGGLAPQLHASAGTASLPGLARELVGLPRGVAYALREDAALVVHALTERGWDAPRELPLGRAPTRIVAAGSRLAFTTTLADRRVPTNHEVDTRTRTLDATTLELVSDLRHDHGRILCGIRDGAPWLVPQDEDTFGRTHCASVPLPIIASEAAGTLRRGDTVHRLAPRDALWRGEQVMHEPTLEGIACASCHPSDAWGGPGTDGARHDIGHPERRPARPLQGLAGTAPFLRDGSYPTLASLVAFPETLLGGYARQDPRRGADLAAFLRSQILTPTPAPAAETLRAGYRAFRAAGCPRCHAPPAFTDRRAHEAANVRSDPVSAATLDTPSLIGAGARPCGLAGTHDLDAFLAPEGPHGAWTPEDPTARSALLAFVRSL